MDLEGRVAPPMANGELVFDAPWQGRVFGMARSLCEQGLYEWDEFREQLIEEIEAWDRAHEPEDEYHYYDHFLNALLNLLENKDVDIAGDLARRIAEFAQRPHGHDH